MVTHRELFLADSYERELDVKNKRIAELEAALDWVKHVNAREDIHGNREIVISQSEWDSLRSAMIK